MLISTPGTCGSKRVEEAVTKECVVLIIGAPPRHVVSDARGLGPRGPAAIVLGNNLPRAHNNDRRSHAWRGALVRRHVKPPYTPDQGTFAL